MHKLLLEIFSRSKELIWIKLSQKNTLIYWNAATIDICYSRKWFTTFFNSYTWTIGTFVPDMDEPTKR